MNITEKATFHIFLKFFFKAMVRTIIYMKFYQLQQLTINVYQHSLPLRMANTWIKTKFHLTPLSQGSSLTIKWKEWSSNRGVIHWWHLSHHNVQCLYCILRYFAILFATQKVIKFQETHWGSKLNFNLVGKIWKGSKIFWNYYPLVWLHAAYNYKLCILKSDSSGPNVTKTVSNPIIPF